jgi:hypothetical protein
LEYVIFNLSLSMGPQRGAAVTGVSGFQYSQPRTTVDLNAEWQVRKNIGLYLSAQNIFNVPEVLLRTAPTLPATPAVTKSPPTACSYRPESKVPSESAVHAEE